jgi:hypothetical protein
MSDADLIARIKTMAAAETGDLRFLPPAESVRGARRPPPSRSVLLALGTAAACLAVGAVAAANLATLWGGKARPSSASGAANPTTLRWFVSQVPPATPSVAPSPGSGGATANGPRSRAVAAVLTPDLPAGSTVTSSLDLPGANGPAEITWQVPSGGTLTVRQEDLTAPLVIPLITEGEPSFGPTVLPDGSELLLVGGQPGANEAFLVRSDGLLTQVSLLPGGGSRSHLTLDDVRSISVAIDASLSTHP